jgi:hypothetical protein
MATVIVCALSGISPFNTLQLSVITETLNRKWPDNIDRITTETPVNDAQSSIVNGETAVNETASLIGGKFNIGESENCDYIDLLKA